MGYALRRGVSCCRVGGRFVFLDIDRDRYFCLGQDAEAAFTRLVETGQQLPIDDSSLAGLVERNILITTGGAGIIRVCSGPLCPTESLLERELRTTVPAVAGAFGDLLGTAVRLKLFRFSRMIARVRRAKARLRPRGGSNDRALATAAAFREAAVLASSPDKCLQRSFAIAMRLLARGVPAELVFGVRLGPFQAHCWVQVCDQVVNDRLDTIRTFTPILVI